MNGHRRAALAALVVGLLVALLVALALRKPASAFATSPTLGPQPEVHPSGQRSAARRASAPVTAPPAVPPQTLEAEEDVTVVVQLLHGQPIIALRPVWTVTVCDHMLLPVMSAEGRVTYTRTVSVSALPCDLSLRADIDGTQVVEHWGRVGRSDVEQPLVIEAPARSLPLGLALARERDMFWRNLDSAPDRLHHRVRGMARSRVLDLLSEDEANAWLDDAMVAWLETR